MNSDSLTLFMFNLRRSAILSALLLSALMVPTIALCQSPIEDATNPVLRAEIESLIKTEYEADNDSSAVARVQKLFTKYGIPSRTMVGTYAVQDFVILLVKDQPLAFMKKAFPAVKAAVDAGRLSSDSELFFRARMHQRAVVESLGKPTNPELRKEIEALHKKDQAVRQPGKPEIKKMQQTDEEDRPAVRSILDRYGMPTFAMVGSDAERDFVDMIQHQPADFRRQALPKLKQNVEDGQASAKNYAMMYDRAQTDQGKSEMYGVNLICQPDGKLAPGPIVDPEQVEQRRAAIGLIPLKTYIRLGNVFAGPEFCKAALHATQK
jgi:hypothetical protein